MENYVIIIIISLALSAFFSGMEIAYMSANRVRMSIYKNDNTILGGAISYLLARPDKYIATTLVGNNITLVVYGYYMGQSIISYIYPEYIGVNNIPFSIIMVQTLISTGVILVTGEFLPKTFFRIYANEMMDVFAVPMYLFYRLMSLLGITDFMLWLSKFMIKKVFHRSQSDGIDFSFGRMDLGYYIEEQIEQLDQAQRDEIDNEINIFRNALEFRDVKARECMVPRTDIKALDVKTSLDDLRDMFVNTGFSKLIIYQDTIDNILGYVHSFDLFKPFLDDIKGMLMPVLYVPESMSVNELLNTLTKKRMSIAVVLDEYGGTSGMVTVEDIIEELLGDIEDEHDKDVLLEKDLGDGNYLFSARCEVDYLNEKYGFDLPESDEYETLAGLIINNTEHIPEKNEEIEIGEYLIIVKEATFTKVETVQIHKKL